LLDPIARGEALQDLAIAGTYLAVGLLLFGHFTRVRWPILVYGWLLLLIPLSTGVYTSIYRVHLVNVALYLVIGLGFRGLWRILGWVLVALFALGEGCTMFLWVIGYLLP